MLLESVCDAALKLLVAFHIQLDMYTMTKYHHDRDTNTVSLIFTDTSTSNRSIKMECKLDIENSITSWDISLHRNSDTCPACGQPVI